MHSDKPLDLDDVSSETPKISELISMLNYALQLRDFSKAEEILVAWKNRLKEEIQDWKINYKLIEKEYGIAAMNNIKIEEDMRECRHQLDALTEQVTRLEEDKRLLKDKAAVYEEREKRVQAKYAKLLEDNERLEKKNRELMVKISESYSERVKADRVLESVQKNKEKTFSRLKQEVEMLVSQPRVKEEKDSTNVINANGTPMGTRSAHLTSAEVNANVNRLKRDGSGFGIHPCNEGQTVVERGDSYRRDKRQKTVTADGKTKSGVVIDISDSDDETPTRNQTPNMPNIALPNGGNKYTSGSQRQRGSTYLGIGVKENCLKKYGFSLSSSSSESCDSDTIFELVKQRRGSS